MANAVGYGDMYPRTLPGRILAFSLCIWGVFMTSLVVVTLTNMVSLTSSELKALRLYENIELKITVEFNARKCIFHFFRCLYYMKRNDPKSEKKAFQQLKLFSEFMAKFKKSKGEAGTSKHSLMDKGDLVAMTENLKKGLVRIVNNQTKIKDFNDRNIQKIDKYFE